MTVAQVAQAEQELGCHRIHAAFALDRLDEDRRRLVVDQRLEGGEVVQFAKGKSGHQRAKTLLDLFLRSRAHAAKRATVKRVLRADDLVDFALFAAGFFHAVETRELEQRFVGLGPAVAEKHATGAGVTDDAFGQLALVRVAKQVADVDEFAGLALHGGDLELLTARSSDDRARSPRCPR